MASKYLNYNKWDKLKAVMLGDCYSADFFRSMPNSSVKYNLQRIADETQEDLQNFETVLKQFGCEVIRPIVNSQDKITDFLEQDGSIQGEQGVPRAPLQPRDGQFVASDKLIYCNGDHFSIIQALKEYDNDNIVDLNKLYFNNDGNDIFPIDAPNITVVGKDIYVDIFELEKDKWQYASNCIDRATNYKFRNYFLDIGGHNDASFHTITPGAIISLEGVQQYKDSFPDWEVCYLPDQSWNKLNSFLQLKHKNDGKWWLPGEEENNAFTEFVETWLQDWVGYVEETVFDVNVLMLDKHHCCVSQNNNEQINQFLRKHNIEPVYIPWRHRYFWDGGLHCITLDLRRDSKQEDYFELRNR